MDAATPSREALWNIEGSWLVYPCFLLVLAVAAYFFCGRSADRSSAAIARSSA